MILESFLLLWTLAFLLWLAAHALVGLVTLGESIIGRLRASGAQGSGSRRSRSVN